MNNTAVDYETVPAPAFGAALTGLGLNLLVRDVAAMADFLRDVLGLDVHRLSADFAIVTYGSDVFQIHADGTYGDNPLLGMLPENPPRGAGIELRLFDTDPDDAAAKAEAAGHMIAQPPMAKPHGLRECYIVGPDGYVWVPSRPLTEEDRA